jgi:O-antigen/teichoic acid export membrane protein
LDYGLAGHRRPRGDSGTVGAVDPTPVPSSDGARAAGAMRRVARVLPAGTGTVGLWVGVSGVLAYVFLAATGRALGASEASGLSTLWVVGFLLGNACGLPVEQEVSRAIATRRAQGVGVGPAIRRAAAASGLFTAAVVALILASGQQLADHLFEGSWALVIALAVLFAATMLEYLVRGVLAGEARFGAYGRLLGVEAGSRVVVVLLLIAVGVNDEVAFAAVLALAPFVGIAAALVGGDGAVLRQPGPEASWREMSSALGWLLAASVLAQALVNLGPVLVRLLSPDDSDLVSAFVASLIVARVPVFLFQAAQAVLVPRLSHHAGGGRGSALAAETRALVLALVGLVAVATIAAGLLGPTVVTIGWGPDFALSGADMAVLAAASCVSLLAVTFGSALIALKYPNRVSYGWAVGVAVFLAVAAVGSDTLTRVETGFLAGTVAASVAMGLLVRTPMRGAEGAPRNAAPVPRSDEGSR